MKAGYVRPEAILSYGDMGTIMEQLEQNSKC
jgi:hypothetical protein